MSSRGNSNQALKDKSNENLKKEDKAEGENKNYLGNGVYKKKWIEKQFLIEYATLNGKYDVILTGYDGKKDEKNRFLSFMIYDKEHTVNLNVHIVETKENQPITGDSKIQVNNSTQLIKVPGVNQSDLAYVVNKNENILNLVDLGTAKAIDSNTTEYNSKITFFAPQGEDWKGRVLKTQIKIEMGELLDSKELLDLTRGIKLVDKIVKD